MYSNFDLVWNYTKTVMQLFYMLMTMFQSNLINKLDILAMINKMYMEIFTIIA